MKQKAIQRILVFCLAFYFVSLSLSSYFETRNMHTQATLFEILGFSCLFSFIGMNLLYVIIRPPTQRFNEKEDKIVQNIIYNCLDRKRLSRKDLLNCIHGKLIEKNIMYITDPQIRDCIEEMIYCNEITEKDGYHSTKITQEESDV